MCVPVTLTSDNEQQFTKTWPMPLSVYFPDGVLEFFLFSELGLISSTHWPWPNLTFHRLKTLIINQFSKKHNTF